jgi:hypothetical protein
MYCILLMFLIIYYVHSHFILSNLPASSVTHIEFHCSSFVFVWGIYYYQIKRVQKNA